jgi:hypothetical protein
MRRGMGQVHEGPAPLRTRMVRIPPCRGQDDGQRQDRIRGCLERLLGDRQVAARVAQGLRHPVDADRVPGCAVRGLTFLRCEDLGIRFWR